MRKDVVFLVADSTMEFTIKGLLDRRESLGVRALQTKIYTHPGHDPGCLREAADFLRPFAGDYVHAVVLFDREGCGQEDIPCEKLEALCESRLSSTGWQDRAAAVVIDPELEVWAWSDSPHVDSALGWAGRTPKLREWLVQEGFHLGVRGKPEKPKEALHNALRVARRPISSSIYRELASTVGFERCQDRAFLRFRQILRKWFPAA
ncbi:MAG: hypothetical protein ACE15C_20000 [Phycisphaerae bacterium]